MVNKNQSLKQGSKVQIDLVYEEKISSTRTTLLFLAITALFFLVFLRRLYIHGLDVMTVIFFTSFCIFLFYVLNYRNLNVRLFDDSLKLSFGVFSFSILLDNIADSRLDDLPAGLRMGGAGIHFMFVRRRYHISFNFLEHPRVVIMLKHKMGLVQEVSFSTRQPQELISAINETTVRRK
jgi:hypothetical protein